MSKAEEEKKRQLEIINKEDHKTLRELERKLKIKPKLNTWPSAFKNDHLDCILSMIYVFDEAFIVLQCILFVKTRNYFEVVFHW